MFTHCSMLFQHLCRPCCCCLPCAGCLDTKHAGIGLALHHAIVATVAGFAGPVFVGALLQRTGSFGNVGFLFLNPLLTAALKHHRKSATALQYVGDVFVGREQCGANRTSAAFRSANCSTLGLNIADTANLLLLAAVPVTGDGAEWVPSDHIRPADGGPGRLAEGLVHTRQG